MPINLPPLSSQLLKGLEQGRSEHLAALSKLLNVAIGNQVTASVEKIEAITPTQREELMKRTHEALQQLLRSPATPAVKAQIVRLQEQQQLLSSEQLKWVHLQVNSRPLLTYTDRALLPGQTVTVQLTDAQRLALVNPSPALTAAVTSSGGVAPTNSAVGAGGSTLAHALAQVLTAGARTASDNPLSATPSDQSASPRSGLTQTTLPVPAVETPVPVTDKATSKVDLARGSAETLNLLAAALRNLLPQKDQPQQLYAALSPLQQMPVERRQAVIPASVQQALKTLADQLRSPQQLSNPKLLPLIVRNSGVFFENKLASQIVDTGVLPKGNPPTGSSPIGPDGSLTNRLTTQDLKGALLQLLHRVKQELPANSGRDPSAPLGPSSAAQSTYPGAATTAHVTQVQQSALPVSLPDLLQLMRFPQRPERELSDKVLRNQLLMLLHQQTLGSLAKIQLQQVQTLSHQQSQTDSAQPTQSWVFDVPVRHGQEVHNLEIKLQQDWVDEGEGENKGGVKVRQWSVTLSFDLPDAGGFYAQLIVINETLSVKLWAEQQTTLSEARLKLDNLHEQLSTQGIVVKQLQCVQGKPPSTSISLHYSLVDITT